MGSVYKPRFTKPLPSNGELFTSKGETFARVKPPKGRAVTYRVTTGRADGGIVSHNFEAIRATGTFGANCRQLAPLLAPSRANLGQAESIAVTSTTQSECDDRAGVIVAKRYPANENASQEASSCEAFAASSRGLEPPTSGSTVRRSNQLSYIPSHRES